MVRNNNMIPNNHFHKNWQRYVRVNFSQPKQKQRRARLRNRNMRQAAPMPVELLRPIVRCPSVRYHTKCRVGRGFALSELKQLGVTKQWAKSVGIAVDHRRRCKSVESRLQNVQRLREYTSRLIIIPFRKQLKKDAMDKIEKTKIQVENINALEKSLMKKTVGLKGRKITEQDRKFGAYETLSQARAEIRKIKRKLKEKNKYNVETVV